MKLPFGLSEAEVTQYHEFGYLIADRILTGDEFDAVRRRTEEIANGRVPYPQADVELEPNTTLRSLTTVRKLNRCVENDSVFLAIARHQPILDLASALIGDDIKLFGSQLFMKPPGGIAKPYHQDSAYFSIEPMALVTCWLALDDVTRENGCMWVIPGSHRRGVLDHSQKWSVSGRQDMQIPDEEIDLLRETPLVMSAGSCSFHHSLLLHRSGPNQTNTPRRGQAIHYMSARSRWSGATTAQPDFSLLQGREYEGRV